MGEAYTRELEILRQVAPPDDVYMHLWDIIAFHRVHMYLAKEDVTGRKELSEFANKLGENVAELVCKYEEAIQASI